MIDPCQNPTCTYFDRCPIRSAALAGKSAVDDSSTSIEETQAGTEPTPCLPASGFKVYELGGFRVGDLTLAGEIREQAVELALGCLQAVPLVEGVFVYAQTPGGNAMYGDVIRAVLGAVRKAVPVVCLVARAQSAGMGILPACSRVLADGAGAILGCEGVGAFFCDGRTPQVIVSTQAPQKWPEPPPLGPDNFVCYDKSFLKCTQANFDARYERYLVDIATARRVPAESLRPILDGRTFLARTALEYGLIDAIGDEAEALKQLVELMRQKEERSRTMNFLKQIFEKKSIDVETAVNGIRDLESRLKAEQAKLEELQRKLNERTENALAEGKEPPDDDSLPITIIRQQAIVSATQSLVAKARGEAAANISKQMPTIKTRLGALEEKKRTLLHQHDAERVTALAAIIEDMGLSVFEPPRRSQRGVLGVPATNVMEQAEVEALLSEEAKKRPPKTKSELDRELETISGEIKQLEILTHWGAEQGLATLVGTLR